MQKIREIGEPNWTRRDIIDSLKEFVDLYEQRPVKDNQGGMRFTHAFATYFMTRQINPACIVESGVWRGQGTWLLEKAAPNAKLICIDPTLRRRKYISPNATYLEDDFFQHDWDSLPKNDTLLFFDDHQDAFKRVKYCIKHGFKHLIFDDNYSASLGDCYSLKKAFMVAGFNPDDVKLPLYRRIKHKFFTCRMQKDRIAPNSDDAEYLKKHLKIYYEFPPIFKNRLTQWGNPWSDEVYPTEEPLFDSLPEYCQKIFRNESYSYLWICYAQL